jgi:hypothetical protein
VTASEDKTTRLWDVGTIPRGNLFDIACSYLPDHNLYGIAGEIGLTDLKPICKDNAPLPTRLPTQ